MADRQGIQLRTKMIGALLRQARTASGRSLKDAGALLGVSGAVFSSYERGRRGISLPELEVLGYQLDVPIARFLHPARGEAKKRSDLNPSVMISLRQHYIGAMIRSHRTEAELTVSQLARLAGIPSSRLTRYEHGERPVPIAELEAIAEALGRELRDYIDTRGPIGEWEANQEAFAAFLRLPSDLRDFIRSDGAEPYLRMAQRLSDLPIEKVRSLGEGFLEITL
jgi:transcriptional regulator with XRE-family HTH domain